VKREQIAEVHWLGKFRGPDFAPISFLLTPGTSERLKDSKGREVWTVTAKPLGAEERATHDAADARNENRVLLVLMNQPGISIAEMAQALGWAYRTGEPDKSRVFRALKTMGWPRSEPTTGSSQKLDGKRPRGCHRTAKRPKCRSSLASRCVFNPQMKILA